MRKKFTFALMLVGVCLLVGCGKEKCTVDGCKEEVYKDSMCPDHYAEEEVKRLEEEESSKIIELKKGEKVTVGECEITVGDFDYSNIANDPDGSSTGLLARDGEIFANLSCNITYLGKEEKYFPFIETYLEYSDGYKFDSEKEWIYNPALHGWLNSTKIAPLTSETGMYLEYEVPMEVKDNENEPIVIHIISEGQEAIYKVR